MSLSAALSVTVALGLAVTAGPRAVSGIPSARAPQQWGPAVMEILQSSLRIEPIRLNDLAQSPSLSAGAASATAIALGPTRLGASYSLPSQPISAVVTRDISQIWRLTIPSGSPGRSHVTATVESLRGESGRLSLFGREEISIPVTVLERAPTLRLDESGSRVMEGGFVLQIPSASLQYGGSAGIHAKNSHSPCNRLI